MNFKLHELEETEYKKLLIETLQKFEGVKESVYCDIHGIPTIGIGLALIIKKFKHRFYINTDFFNDQNIMELSLAPNEKEEVKLILEDIVKYFNANTLMIDQEKQAYTKCQLLKMLKSFKLNDKQITKMLDKKIDEAENLVKNRGINLGFSRERLILVDLVFNSPELLGKNLSKAVKNGDRLRAWYEIRYKSNGDQSVGIAKRRYEESEMFNCFETDLLSKDEIIRLKNFVNQLDFYLPEKTILECIKIYEAKYPAVTPIESYVSINLIEIILKKVRYPKDNIGDDFEIETNIGNQINLIKLQLPNGKTKILSQIVFQEITKEIAVSLVVKIKVTEKDLVFSDTGCVKETISLDLTQNLKE
ncbi:MAG: hypothetical protein WC860_09840, partial [Candidatus Margulisiibacteriota bacterium]